MSKCISKEEEEREERKKEEAKFECSIESLKSQKNIAAIVGGMKLHATHAGIQDKACEAVLALTPCVEAEEWQKIRDEKGDAYDSVMAKYAEFAKLGVIEHLVQVLSLHMQSTSAVISTCKIIRCISRNADNKVLIAKEGGIPKILAALDCALCSVGFPLAPPGQRGFCAGGDLDHAQHAGVVENACAAVKNLAVNDENRVLIAKEGGIPLILAALDNHAKHAGVVENACWALCNIGWSDKTVQKSIKDAGASKLVRAAVARLDATADTKKYGQMLLDKLAQL